jgi:hypothetical protein
MLQKHDESVEGKHRVSECDDSHTNITFPSPGEEAEYTQASGDDKNSKTDVLFEEFNKCHIMISVHVAGAT